MKDNEQVLMDRECEEYITKARRQARRIINEED